MVDLELMNICEGECNCCIVKIYRSMKEHPKEWREMSKTIVADTPLHKAAGAGNTAVAMEILNLMPCLGRKLNEEGLSPLHVAMEREHREMVERVVEFEGQLVRVKGKGGETPLMQWAAKASQPQDKELLASLLLACPESVKDVNNSHESVVHVAMRKNKCDDIACILVDWLRRRDQITSVLSLKDVYDNTALHTAAQYGCLNGAKKLVNLVQLNMVNQQNKTPLDLAVENHHMAVADLLEKRGAKKKSDISTVDTIKQYVLRKPTFAEAISRAYYYLTRELTLEMRGNILVVATLIITTTYQAVLQPPGGVYPPPDGSSTARFTSHSHQMMMGRGRGRGRGLVSNGATPQKHVAGQMVMEEEKYRYYMPSNSFAFALSTVIIIFVVPGSPLFLILHVCLVFMCVSYLLALDAISADNGISDMIYGLALYAIVGAYIVKLAYYPVKALLVDEDWWLRRFNVRFSNWSTTSRWGSGRTFDVGNKMKKQHLLLDL